MPIWDSRDLPKGLEDYVSLSEDKERKFLGPDIFTVKGLFLLLAEPVPSLIILQLNLPKQPQSVTVAIRNTSTVQTGIFLLLISEGVIRHA